jgi:hypothetical protein
MKQILAAIALSLPFSTHALVIDFEGHVPMDDGAQVQYQDGFTFTFSAAGWGIFEDAFVGGGSPYTSNGSARLLAAGSGTGPATVTMTASDSSLFSIFALDAATMFPGFSGSMDIVGMLADASTVSQTLAVTDAFASYSLDPVFSNLVSLSFSETVSGAYRTTPGFALDNLIVSEASSIPEPSTLALLGLGLLGVGFSSVKKPV